MPKDGFSPVQPVMLTAHDLRVIRAALEGHIETLRYWSSGQAASDDPVGAVTDARRADEMVEVLARLTGILAVKEAA